MILPKTFGESSEKHHQRTMTDSPDSAPRGPKLRRQESLQQVQELTSVWGTLKDKPTFDDIDYAVKETELYGGQLLPTRSEILAWYLYDWAHSPMFNVAQGLVLPLLISALALQYGCENVTKYGCNVNDDPINESGAVIVYMGNWALKPSAFVQVCTSFSGAMQAVAYISIGALADYSYYQYYLFRICTIIASIMPLFLFFCSSPSSYLFAGWWVAIQLVFFGLALIFYNAYLPQIVENHWIVRREVRQKKPTDETCYIKQQITDDMSQYGTACGYLGSLIMTFITTAIFAVSITTNYEQLTGYGLTTGTNNFNEEWLKPVEQIQMRFDNTGLKQIQLLYKDMDINGIIYGDQTSSETLLTYSVVKNDFITSIEYWLNTDKSINAMRFMTQSGLYSDIYGTNNTVQPEKIAISTESIPTDFIFAGYVVYINNNYITGMDVTMLNESTGQFQSTMGMRIAMLLVFIWWNFFQLFVFKYLKRRDGPPLPESAHPITFSIKQFYYAIKSATKYPNMFRYLLAWFCFSDGLNTLSVTAVLFATTEMNMSSFEAALLVLEALFLGSWGGVFFLWLQRKLGWNAKQMLLLHIIIFICLCLYTMIGLIPGVPFGLVSKPEMYMYVFVFGCNWGSIQSYARSVFAYLVPIGKESQMFALYEITDKGSSWIGPLMVALITNIASIRYGMFYVTIFFAVAAPLLIWGVDLQVGMMEAGRWNKDVLNQSNLIDNYSNDNKNNNNQTKYKETEMVDNNSNDNKNNNNQTKYKETEMVDNNSNDNKNN
eukprot:40245_1